YGPKGVQVVESAMDLAGEPAVNQFIGQFHPPFPVGYTPHQDALEFLQIPVITPGFVPKMALIDREGIIREQHNGGDPYFTTPEASIRNSLDAMLQQEQAKSKKGATK